MKITAASHKALLSNLFYEKTGQIGPEGQPIYQPIHFPFDKLMDAASAAKKLAKGSRLEDGRVFYNKGVIELTPAEASVVNDLFNKHKDQWDITVADTVMELQELFHSADGVELETAVEPNRAERRRAAKGK